MASSVSESTARAGTLGALGVDYIDDTDTHSVDLNYENTDGTPSGYVYHQGFPYWRQVIAMSDAVINTLTSHSEGIDPGWDTSDTLSKDQSIEGKFTVVDLTSGTVKLVR